MSDPGNIASTSGSGAANPGADSIWKAAAYGELSLVQARFQAFKAFEHTIWIMEVGRLQLCIINSLTRT